MTFYFCENWLLLHCEYWAAELYYVEKLYCYIYCSYLRIPLHVDQYRVLYKLSTGYGFILGVFDISSRNIYCQWPFVLRLNSTIYIIIDILWWSDFGTFTGLNSAKWVAKFCETELSQSNNDKSFSCTPFVYFNCWRKDEHAILTESLKLSGLSLLGVSTLQLFNGRNFMGVTALTLWKHGLSANECFSSV